MTRRDVTASRGRAWALLAVMATSGCAAEVAPEVAPAESVAPSPQALDEAPTWAATGSMSVARQDGTATRLADGRVLVTGGRGFGSVDAGSVYFQSAELFDPATGTFAPVAKMAAKRSQHAAVALASGKVLVVGGAPSPTTAEIFDPASATWTSTLPLAHDHWSATLTLLPGGQVFLAGGSSGPPAGASEIFDPASGAWKDAAPMSTPRRYHTATLLLDGRVLVTGGQRPDDGTITPSVEIFDPAAGTWSSVSPLLTARSSHTATRLDDGTVLVVGGSTPSAITAAVERYDPAKDLWTAVLPLESARAIHSATRLDSGAVLVAGGLDATSSALRSSELFDPKTARWVASGLLVHGRLAHMAETLTGGAVLLTGGEYQSSAEIYRPADGGQRCEVGPQCASGHCVDSVCCDEECSGRCVTCALAGAEGTCSPAPPGTDPHHDCGQGAPCDSVCDAASACVSRVGEACVATTCTEDGTEAIEGAMCSVIGGPCTQVEVSCAPYRCGAISPTEAGCVTQCRSIDDCADGYACDTEGKCRARPDVAAADAVTCSAAPRPPGSPRAVAAWLTGLALLVASRRRRAGRKGLRASAVVAALALAGALTWSPALLADDSSQATSSMSTVRWHHVAAKLPHGRVLVAGGLPGSASSTAEIYDPSTGAWTPTGTPMLYAHDWPIGAALCDGRVFVAGRNDSNAREAEIYDPATDTWIAAGKMKLTHIYGTATLLADCRLLLTGGYNSNTQAEVFYPDTKIFKSVGVMNSERFFHTATRLADGRVLAAGGGVDAFGQWFTYATVDIFDPKTNLWTKATKMNEARRAHSATLLPDGRVLVAGGNIGGKNDGTEAGTQLDSAELYDPATDTWEKVPSRLVTARTFHTAALLPGGALLLFGGLDGSGSASRQVEGYFGETWQPLDPMPIDRYQHASALLDDGRVLLAGGVYQATAEVYRLAANGEACASNLACGGGHCVDDHCCDEACTTGCRRCDVPGKEGTCSLPCSDDTHALACSDGSATCTRDLCVAQSCGELRCDAATATCKTACVSVEDCAPGYACDQKGACVAPPDVSSADPGACSAAALDRRWGAGLGVGAMAAAITLLRRRRRRC
jgi:N-acetylneuraminic acid mutarotase